MKKKRRYGSGSYIELPKKGLWAFSFSLGTGTDGRRKRITIYGRTKAECKRKFEDERARQGGMLAPPSPETVQGFIDAWLENLKLRKKLTTTSTYENVLKYVKPLLGTVKLTRFDSASAQRLYSALHAKGVTPSVLEKIHIALHACFNTAVKSGKIIRNPFTGLAPSYHPATMQVFTSNEARKFIQALKEHPLEAVFILAIATGLRQGEILGLRWEDIDWDNKRIAIRVNLQEVAGKLAIVPAPKTRTSRRPISASSIVLAALKRRREIAKKEGHKSAYVFATPAGLWIRKKSLRDRYDKLIKKAEVKRVKFHELRHSAVSLLGAMGVPMKVISEIVGHSRSSITADVYSHYAPIIHDEALEKLSDTLLQEPESEQKTAV